MLGLRLITLLNCKELRPDCLLTLEVLFFEESSLEVVELRGSKQQEKMKNKANKM